jgi:TRAP-type C4-dicarboxylate transport system permease small subunit
VRKFINKFEEYLLLIMLAVMCIVMALQVFYRYALGSPLVWSEEMARFLFVWITFIGAGYGIKNGLHIEMTYFYDKFPEKVQKFLQIVLNLVTIFFCIYLIPYAVEFVKSQHTIASTTLGFPMSIWYASVPIGFTLLVLRLIQKTVPMIIVKKEKSEMKVGSSNQVIGGEKA